jgi:hypothetical protein
VGVPAALNRASVVGSLTLGPTTLGPHTLSGTLTLGSPGGPGTLRVAKGAVLDVGAPKGATSSTVSLSGTSKIVDAGTARLHGSLTLQGDGSFACPGTLASGTARLGAGSAAVAIPGTLRITLEHVPSGWIAGRIGGGSPVNVDGGALIVAKAGTGTASAGTRVTLIKAATSLVGRFANVSLPSGWSPSRTATTLQLVA